MLSNETEEKLIQIFITISVGEEKINKLKQEVLKNMNINPLQFFFKLSEKNSNCITKQNILSYINSFSYDCNNLDLEFIFFLFFIIRLI